MAFSNDFFGFNQTIPLSDAADINASTVNPSKMFEWINYTDISSVGEHVVQEPLTMPAESAPSRARRKLNTGDIVISTVRPNRRSFFKFENQWENPICSTGFAVVSPKNKSNAEYLYALLTSHAATDFYESICEGGAYPAFNGVKLHDMPIPWPEANTRHAVGRMAADLQKLIEVNQLISSTLEQIAQTIFKSWFVDFDPVHAKARGELPVGIDAETAALFPDSFEDSELGPIPTGWEIKSLTDLAEYRNGLALQKYPATGDGTDLPVLKIPQLKANSVDGAGFASNEVPEKFVIVDGDCVFSWSGALEVRIWCGGVAALNQHLFKVIPLETPIWNAYLHTLNHLEEFRGIAEGKATTMGHIKRGDLDNAKFAACPAVLIEKANEVISPLLSEFVVRWQQNRTLISLRDSLLPRLISGELDIPTELLEA